MIKRIINHLFKLCATPEAYARHIGVKIGTACYISTRSWPSEPYLIEIGDYVRIASNTSFYTHGGTWTLRKIYNDNSLDTFGRIKIGDYTYIGEQCMIMPGVTIGKNCIIGGGSVVTRSVPDGIMVAGNPARFIGYTESFYNRIKDNKALCCKGKNIKEKEKYLLSLPETEFVHKGNIKLPEK